MALLQPLSISDLVLHLRKHLNLFQDKSAAILGVSFKAGNRQGTGHSLPSPRALNLIEELLTSIGESRKSLLQQYFSEGGSDV